MSSFHYSSLIISLLLASLPIGHAHAQNQSNERNQPGETDKPLIFGVAPFMSPVALVKRLAPLRNYLSQSINQTVIIETTKTAKDFVPKTISRQFDFIMTSPSFALKVVDSGLYDLKLTQARPLVGHIVVLVDSPIMTIDDLANKKIGTPPETGFLGQLSHSYFERLGLKKKKAVTVQHFHSHNDAISALRLGETQASFIADFMEKHINDHGVKIKTIARSRQYPGLTVLTSTKLEAGVANKITDALLKLGENEKGHKLLQQISLSGFRPINGNELEKVRPYIQKNTDR